VLLQRCGFARNGGVGVTKCGPTEMQHNATGSETGLRRHWLLFCGVSALVDQGGFKKWE
jgi:hypothetical protein